MDFYPSDNFEDGEPSDDNELDFTPIFRRRVFLSEDGKVYADVYSDKDINFELNAENAINILKQLADKGVFQNPNYDKNPEGYGELPDNFFEVAKEIRGPFLDNVQVQKWLTDSGLRRVAIPYYDSTTGYFWIDVNTN